MIKLNKNAVFEILGNSNVFAKVSELLLAYKWNNFLHLKVQVMFEDILESDNAAFKSSVLQKTDIGMTLLKLSEEKKFAFSSTREIRHGAMSFVIKLANLLIKHKSKDEVAKYLSNLPAEWNTFVDDELKKSNDINSKNLGG